MAKSFAELKKQRSAHLAALTTKLADVSGQKYADDDSRFWQPTVDKEGNGYAVIRFLPEIENEDVPFVRVWNHGFQGPGGWYIENCLTTIGKDDPVAEYNNILWNSTQDDKSPARKQARDQKRKLNFISNIVVVEDPSKPENEGKVFLFKYGKKIFDKIKEKMEPEFKDELAINPFDLWEGANFKLKIRKVEGYRNYDRSEFELENKKGYPLDKDDKKMETLWKQAYPLAPFVAEDQFKSYAELKAKMIKVLGKDPFADKDAAPEPEREAPKLRQKASTKAADPVEDDDIPFDPSSGDEGDDDMQFFKNLVEK